VWETWEKLTRLTLGGRVSPPSTPLWTINLLFQCTRTHGVLRVPVPEGQAMAVPDFGVSGEGGPLYGVVVDPQGEQGERGEEVAVTLKAVPPYSFARVDSEGGTRNCLECQLVIGDIVDFGPERRFRYLGHYGGGRQAHFALQDHSL